MNTGLITTAARQYANRPADERFESLDALITAATLDKQTSAAKVMNVKDLRVQPNGDSVELVSPKGSASMTHFAFGQFARTVGAPAGYLRELPADLIARNLNHGISITSADVNLLVKRNAEDDLLIRAATSDTYGRVWDADLYASARDQIFNHRSSGASQGAWTLPGTWDGKPAGAYRGDRDSFLIMVDGGSIVDNPSIGFGANHDRPGGRPMFRGVMIGNSEVGGGSVWVDCVLFDFVCGNHNLWGACIDQQYRRRHVGQKVLNDTIREIGNIATRWTQRSAERDAAIVRGLMNHEIAQTKEAVVDELRKMGATKEDAISAYERCERTESASPRSFWGISAGLTRVSQESKYQDERNELDQLAGKILARGAKLVAA